MDLFLFIREQPSTVFQEDQSMVESHLSSLSQIALMVGVLLSMRLIVQ